MSRKNHSRKNGNGAHARRQGDGSQLPAMDKGISVEEPCPVLVIATTGAGKTASVFLTGLSILGSAVTRAQVKSLAGNQ